MTQREPLLPKISNVVVEAVVCHWEYMVEEGGVENGRENRSGDEAAQPARRMIRGCNDRKRRTDEGQTGFKVQEALF